MSPEESYNDEDPSTTKTIPKPEPLLLEPENLEDRVVVVTGGGWNIGRAIALRCAHQRATVIICSRNEKNLLATVEAAAEADLNVRHVVLDIKDPDSVASEFEEIIATESRIDVLACMAGGFGAGKPLHETDPGEWLDVVLRNLYGTFLCCRAVLPGMIERRQGDILTCAGGGAFFPVIGLNATAYACAKAAICRFTDQLYS
ncbi:MAG: SDR family NAD(P)-dependent oxidoreductase, partial [Planctomycetota bacterium]